MCAVAPPPSCTKWSCLFTRADDNCDACLDMAEQEKILKDVAAHARPLYPTGPAKMRRACRKETGSASASCLSSAQVKALAHCMYPRLQETQG